MTKFNRVLQGGRAVTGNALAPRSRRAGTAQVSTYWSGIQSGRVGADGFGGTGVQTITVGGSKYFITSFTALGDFTVTSKGTFTFYLIGGGASGHAGNGYNFFGLGGSGGSITQTDVVLGVGTYPIVIGAGATAPVYSRADGSPSTGAGLTAAGGATSTSGGTNANGAAGTDVSTFIGGASLFKAAGGGNANTGIGGSGVGGNGAGYATAGSAAANTASGGGGAGGSGQPNLLPGVGGNGGSGIVYIRWLV